MKFQGFEPFLSIQPKPKNPTTVKNQKPVEISTGSVVLPRGVELKHISETVENKGGQTHPSRFVLKSVLKSERIFDMLFFSFMPRGYARGRPHVLHFPLCNYLF